jgi:tRNA pseudouridine13 synthase
MNVLTTEKKVGIKTFFTPFKGVNGKLRTQPEDFFVTEISNYPSKTDSGRFTIAEVTATNWESNILIRDLSNRLHVSRQRVGFAGTKDKRAKTTRLMSFFNIPIEKLSELKIKDVEINNIYYSNSSVKIGNLIGNRFEIIVRNIDKKTDLDNIQKNCSFLKEKGGFMVFSDLELLDLSLTLLEKIL